MYQQLYSMLVEFVYGSGAVLTNYQDLVITLFATAAVLAVLVIPFVVVYWVVRLVVNLFG